MTTKIPWCSQNAGTFDASTAYTYFLNISPVDLFKRMIGSGATPEDYKSLVNRANAGQLRDVLERANIDTDESDAGERTAEAFASAATAAYESFAGFLKNDTTPEVHTAIFPGQQGRNSRPVRAIIGGQQAA